MRKLLSFVLAVLIVLAFFAGCEKRPDKNDIADYLSGIDESAQISFWSLYPSEDEQQLSEENKKLFIDSIVSVSKKDIEWNKSMVGPAPAEYAFVIRTDGEEERAMQYGAGCVEIQREGVSWLIKDLQ